MIERDPNIVKSGLSRTVRKDGVTVDVSIGTETVMARLTDNRGPKSAVLRASATLGWRWPTADKAAGFP